MSEIYAFGTFTVGREPRWPGIVRDGQVLPLAGLVPDAPMDLLSLFQNWGEWNDRIHEALQSGSADGWQPEAELVAHLPYIPENLLGAGANYRKHVIELIVDTGAGGVQHLDKEERRIFAEKEMDARAESGKPFIWVGLRSAIAGPACTLLLPHDVLEPDWELELAVVIGKVARRVSRDQALDYVAGYTIANDVTARELVARPDLKNLGMDWLACKSAPGFHIIGPYVTPARFVADPQQLQIRLSLNGRTMQDESTNDMIFGVARLIEFISAHAMLHPGDIIMTGSPSGNGTHYNRFLQDGDEMLGEIDGLAGVQRVRCAAEIV